MTELSLENAKDVDEKAKRWGKKYEENDVTTSQLRQIYSEIKRAQNEFRFEEDGIEKARQTLVLLKPRLAYSAARSDDNEMEMVKDDFSNLIDTAINGDERCMRMFFQIMEAIVAYHAYFENGGEQ